jgi:hypothetical protein
MCARGVRRRVEPRGYIAVIFFSPYRGVKRCGLTRRINPNPDNEHCYHCSKSIFTNTDGN